MWAGKKVTLHEYKGPSLCVGRVNLSLDVPHRHCTMETNENGFWMDKQVMNGTSQRQVTARNTINNLLCALW